MTRRELDAAIAALARRQHGAFSGRQARKLGTGSAAIRRRVESGQWLRLDLDVYALPGNPPTWTRQVKAAELGHPAAAVCGAAAGVVHSLGDLRPGRITVNIPHGTQHRSEIAEVRRRDGIAVALVDGIRVTDIPQTLLDLAPLVPAETLLHATEDALRQRDVDADEVARRVLDPGRRRIHGVGRLRAVLDGLLGTEELAETDLERLLHRAIRRAGIRPVLYQAAPPWWPGGKQRLDALLPEHRTIVEADGRAWHTRVADFERDRERDNLAAVHGHHVVRLTRPMPTSGLAASIDLLRRLQRAENGGSRSQNDRKTAVLRPTAG